jgi:hypothetical protein
MARIWVEQYTGSGVPIDYWGHSPTPRAEDRNLVPRNMLMVAVASFTFRFVSVEQIRDCLSYYEQKTHPSSRIAARGGDHWEFQRWFERLPMYLLEDAKRTKVVKALRKALEVGEAGAFAEMPPSRKEPFAAR